MTAVLAAIAVKLALKIVALVAGAIALVRFLIKPGDPVFVRALLAGLGLVLVGGALAALVFAPDGDAPADPDRSVYQQKVGALCDALEDAAGDYAAEAQKPDPYGVVGPYKIYEAREADFRELRSPKKLEQRHIAAAALARRHTETIVVTTNRLVRADTAADRRRILKSREATTSKLEGELATDLGRLAGGKCNLSVFGSAVPA